MDFPTLLREHNLRATPGRIHMLEALSKEQHPVSVDRIREALPVPLDTVTVYRTLETFEAAHLVMRTDLQHGHAHYELVHGRPHHHHAVCRSCGLIEDIEISHPAKPEKEAERAATKFAAIDSYALEFFGTCTSCA